MHKVVERALPRVPERRGPRRYSGRVILTLDVPRAVCETRQTNGVPASVFDAMEEQLTSEAERFPPWWTHATAG